MTTWQPFEWIALIGAAAWVPHIVVWIYKLAVKPKLFLVVGQAPEVGYTTYGPIFNLECAYSVQRKDALIVKVSIELTHERGQKTYLTWKTLNETLSRAQSTTGETAEFTKNQTAIALQISTTNPSEKLIGFQDYNFQLNKQQCGYKLANTLKHFKNTEKDDYVDRTLKSKEFAELCEFFKNGFSWQSGNYSVIVKTWIQGARKPHKFRFNFELTNQDFEGLESNIKTINQVYENTISPPTTPVNEFWYWARPILHTQS